MVCPRRRLCTSRYPGKRRGKRSCTLASSLDYMWAVSLPNRPGKMKITLQSNKDTSIITSLGMSLQTSLDTVEGSFVQTGTSTCRHSFVVTFFLKDFQQLMADHPSRPPYGQLDRKNTTFFGGLMIYTILQLEMYCPGPGCQSDCQQTFLHLWLVTGRQTFLATFFWMSRQTCAESFVNFFLDRDFGFNLSLNLK